MQKNKSNPIKKLDLTKCLNKSGNVMYSDPKSDTNGNCETRDVVSGVKNSIKLYTVNSNTEGGGAMTTIDATKDGSFYDLGIIIK